MQKEVGNNKKKSDSENKVIFVAGVDLGTGSEILDNDPIVGKCD